MRKLEWDEEAEGIAQEWADACTAKRKGDPQGHRSSTKLGELGMGENLAFSTDPFVGKKLLSGVQGWYDEVNFYTYASGACQPGKMCGHYTQVVDTRSLKIGCATNRRECKNGYPYVFVCNYSPAGNFNRQKPYEVGARCSSCQPENKYCKDGFCSDCEPGDKGCSCKVDCGRHTTVKSTCSCKCKKGAWGPTCKKPCVNTPQCTDPGYDKYPVSTVCVNPYFSEQCAKKCQKTC
ncbi:cysteine-rich venom protein-like isoform X3 [Anneissia japonica]|nr:cysteine-rich venom protein-like isoform X3 [Anneissia japonica]